MIPPIENYEIRVWGGKENDNSLKTGENCYKEGKILLKTL